MNDDKIVKVRLRLLAEKPHRPNVWPTDRLTDWLTDLRLHCRTQSKYYVFLFLQKFIWTIRYVRMLSLKWTSVVGSRSCLYTCNMISGSEKSRTRSMMFPMSALMPRRRVAWRVEHSWAEMRRQSENDKGPSAFAPSFESDMGVEAMKKPQIIPPHSPRTSQPMNWTDEKWEIQWKEQCGRQASFASNEMEGHTKPKHTCVQ